MRIPLEVVHHVDRTQGRPRPSRPEAPVFANIPIELKLRDQWLCWRYSKKPNDLGKFGKVPYSIVDKQAAYTDYRHLLPFETVVKQYSHGKYDGIGIVLGRGLAGLDEDHCVGADGVDPKVLAHVQLINSYTERSVSGDGYHTIAIGTALGGRCRSGNHGLYFSARYFVMTGQQVSGTPTTVEYRQTELQMLYQQLFCRHVKADPNAVRIPEGTGSIDHQDEGHVYPERSRTVLEPSRSGNDWHVRPAHISAGSGKVASGQSPAAGTGTITALPEEIAANSHTSPLRSAQQECTFYPAAAVPVAGITGRAA